VTLHSPKPASYADIEALPPNVVGEILFGALVTHPRPASRHTAAASKIGAILGPPFDFGSGGPGGWTIYDEPELHLGPHVAVPDLAGWRAGRLDGYEDVPWFEVVPDWICEVMSPSTRSYDIGAKRRIYATYKVKHLWYIDPVAKSLEVFTINADASWNLTHTIVGQETVSAPPFDTISFSLGQLWLRDNDSADSNDEA
jgi:Putative restriction endonuclease